MIMSLDAPLEHMSAHVCCYEPQVFRCLRAEDNIERWQCTFPLGQFAGFILAALNPGDGRWHVHVEIQDMGFEIWEERDVDQAFATKEEAIAAGGEVATVLVADIHERMNSAA